MISPWTIVQFLFFRESAIVKIAASPAAIGVGAGFVLSAGFAREYDGEYLLAEPWHLLIPLVASLLGCIVLFITLAIIDANCTRKSFVPLLRVYWMMAPMAWLYAIPFERFLSAGDATRANLCLLGVVAIWRVALMIRCIQVLFHAHLVSATVPVLLFGDALALLALKFVPGPIFMIMGGVRLTESEGTILGMRMLLGFVGVIALPFLVISFAVLCNRGKPWRWIGKDPRWQPVKVARATWAVVILSLLIWIPILPTTQKEQALRYDADRFIRGGDFGSLVTRLQGVAQAEMPPHWDPPPRTGYGEFSPHVHDVAANLMDSDAPDWLIERYVEKLRWQASSGVPWFFNSHQFTEHDVVAYVDLLERIDPEVGREIARHVRPSSEMPGDSSPRADALRRLRKIAGVEEEPKPSVEAFLDDEQDTPL